MKRQILINLFLFTFFCVSPLLSQTQLPKLKTEFIKLEKIRFSEYPAKRESSTMSDAGADLTEEQKAFLRIFDPLFPERGGIEVDTKSNFVIVTDIENRIKFHKEFLAILDDSNLSFNDIVSRKSGGLGNYSLEIPLQNLQLTTGCGTGEEKISWREKQASILLSVIRNFFSSDGSLEVDGRAKVLTVTDDRKRVIVIKQIAELFDKPFLEESNEK